MENNDNGEAGHHPLLYNFTGIPSHTHTHTHTHTHAHLFRSHFGKKVCGNTLSRYCCSSIYITKSKLGYQYEQKDIALIGETLY